ncbi:MAG: helix-turn-helix transcriptional regulator, partial [Planctomycetes bacterium]|nr:helix-turn-helix transcriptional regulator [Planctomycetota bacterium]
SENWSFVFLTFWGCSGLAEAITKAYGHVHSLPPSQKLIGNLLAFESQNGSVLSLSATEGAKMVNDLLWGLVSLYEEGDIHDASARLVSQARVQMRRHLESAYTMQNLADDLQVSMSHLSRVFKAETGHGPLTIFQKMKMEHATEMLQETNLRVKEIAAMLGFDGASNFTRSFRRITGRLPQSFRQD